MKKVKKFVITGGHHNSALVVAKLLTKLGHQVIWFGHRYAATGDNHDSAEYIEVQASGIPFYNLRAGKSSLNPAQFLKTPFGLAQALTILSKINPDALISFGGYLGFTSALAARTLRIPIFLHEQTVVAGKANLWSSRLAAKIYLTWESSRKYYPADKSRVVGLPLRPSFSKLSRQQFFSNNQPTLLVLGGKQGSHVINKLIFSHLSTILGKYNLIHQTGTSSRTGDYDRAVSIKESFPANISSKYLPRGYIGEEEIGQIMQNSDLVIGRSGAHVTYELGVLGQKSVLIPYLSTHKKEQLQNARMLAKNKLAIIIPQSELSYPKLEDAIKQSFKSPKAKSLPLPRNAAALMVKDLLKELN